MLIVAVVVSVLKDATPISFSWSKNGVRRPFFVVYLVLSTSKRLQQLGPGLVQYNVLYSQFDVIFDRIAANSPNLVRNDSLASRRGH